MSSEHKIITARGLIREIEAVTKTAELSASSDSFEDVITARDAATSLLWQIRQDLREQITCDGESFIDPDGVEWIRHDEKCTRYPVRSITRETDADIVTVITSDGHQARLEWLS